MRRTHPCLTCPPQPQDPGKFSLRRGFTRHKDRICSHCRRSPRVVRFAGGLAITLDSWQRSDALASLDSELRRPEHYQGRGGW